MEVYKAESIEIFRRYRVGQISSRECAAALDASLARLLLQLRPEELPGLKTIVIDAHVLLLKPLVKQAD